jgi:hypothetical protein
MEVRTCIYKRHSYLNIFAPCRPIFSEADSCSDSNSQLNQNQSLLQDLALKGPPHLALCRHDYEVCCLLVYGVMQTKNSDVSEEFTMFMIMVDVK